MAASYPSLDMTLAHQPEPRSRGQVIAIDEFPARDAEESSHLLRKPVLRSHEESPADSFYPALEAGSPELANALRLLAKTENLVREARALIEAQDLIGSDLAVQRLFAPLSELFNCRRLGDGFATLVNALLCALENLNGSPMNPAQLNAVAKVLAIVHSEPYMQHRLAAERVDILEDVGLNTTPRGYEHLADWLDGKSVR